MSLLSSLYNRIYQRRTRVLTDWLCRVIPPNARILDVGCGDGRIDSLIIARRPDLTIEGIDVLLRPTTHIPVKPFDGKTIPHPDASFDVVMMIDVLHHTPDPLASLRESARVARQSLVIKDHTVTGPLAWQTLRMMDWFGNARHGVVLPYNFWRKSQWLSAAKELNLTIAQWEPKLHLYPWYASPFFDRRLQFIARLDKQK